MSLAAVLFAVGCGMSAKESGGAAEAIKKPELLCPRAGADRVEASSFRGDGKNDIVKVFSKMSEPGGGPAVVALSCKELDLNGDGRKDMVVYYDSRGRKVREEFDHDFDGVPDMKSYYEGGQLVRQELDVDFDGKPDLVEYFEGGKRVRIEKFLALPPAVQAGGPADGASAAPPYAPAAGSAPMPIQPTPLPPSSPTGAAPVPAPLTTTGFGASSSTQDAQSGR